MINGSTFSWNNPQPAGTDYYITFRASDAGGALANKVIKLTLIQGGGGCPIVDVRTEDGWQEENTILGRSLTGQSSLDRYRIKGLASTDQSEYHVRIRENEREQTSLDEVSLVSVDHDPNVRAFVTRDGILLGTRAPARRIVRSTGEDVTQQVDGSTPEGLVLEPGEVLLVERADLHGVSGKGTGSTLHHTPFHLDDDDKGGGGGSPVGPIETASVNPVDRFVLEQTGILIQVPDGRGGWETLDHRYPREHPDEYVNPEVPNGPVRLVSVGRHRLRFVGDIVPVAEGAPQTLTLLGARHSRLGEVSASVAGADGAFTTIAPNDTITLRFAAPAPVPGATRGLFLLTRGVYTSLTEEGANPIERLGGVSSAFALGPARPNPTTGRVTLGFTLGRDGEASLRVYDVAGRLVRTLFDRGMEAGPHEAAWDGRDETGVRAPAGVYFYRLDAQGWHSERKLIVLVQ